MLCYITPDMLCYITHVMLCYTTHDMLCYITHVMLYYITHVISVLEKCQFWILCKAMFILRRKAFFLTRTSPNTFSGCILHKTKRWQNFKFLTKTMDPSTFWKKCQFCEFFKPVFSLLRNACFLYKMSKIVFSRFIFTIYEMGIQGVTRGCRELQGVTGGYKGFKGVTGD